MKRIIIQILTAILLLIGLSLSLTAIAWSINSNDLYFLFLFLGTLAGFILTFIDLKISLYTLSIISIFWLLKLAEDFGYYIVFKPNDFGFLFVIAAPILVSILLLIISSNLLFERKIFRSLVVGFSLLIPFYGIMMHANKTYEKKVFSEYYNIDSANYKAVFRKQPLDSRKFEISLDSEELRNLIKENATLVGDMYYFHNTKLRVQMNFSNIKEIELYQVSDFKLSEPIKWDISVLEESADFLK